MNANTSDVILDILRKVTKQNEEWSQPLHEIDMEIAESKRKRRKIEQEVRSLIEPNNVTEQVMYRLNAILTNPKKYIIFVEPDKHPYHTRVLDTIAYICSDFKDKESEALIGPRLAAAIKEMPAAALKELSNLNPILCNMKFMFSSDRFVQNNADDDPRIYELDWCEITSNTDASIKFKEEETFETAWVYEWQELLDGDFVESHKTKENTTTDGNYESGIFYVVKFTVEAVCFK